MAIDFPNSPAENEQYTVGDRTWTWNGTYWELSTSTSTFTAGDSEPVDADPGDIWFDSTIGKTFVNYNGTWVEIGNAATVVDVIADADADTKVQVEVTADSDKIEFTTAGTKRLEIDASGHVIPAANETYDLGSASNRFRDIYLSGTTIDLGGVEISSDGTSLTMPPVSNISGDLTVDTDTLHVDSTNNRVGIGTTTPSSALEVFGIIRTNENVDALSYYISDFKIMDIDSGVLRIDPTGFRTGVDINNDLTITGDLTVDTDTLHVDSTNDRVGIGTTTPGVSFDVEGLGRFVSPNNGSTGAVILRQPSGDAAGSYLQWVDNANSAQKAYIYAGNDGNMEILPNGGNLSITGNVGIGTASPGYSLEVNDEITLKGTAPYLRLLETTGISDVHIWLGQDGSSNEGLHTWYESATGHSYIDNIYSTGNLYLRTNNGSNSNLTLRSNGDTVVQYDKAIFFSRDSAASDLSTFIKGGNNPDGGYSSGDQNYWVHLSSKGGTIVTLNTDGSATSPRNNFDHFSIYQAAPNSTSGRRLFSVNNIGDVQFGNAGVRIDRGWSNYPSITVQRDNAFGTDNTSYAEFRVHGISWTHAEWVGGASGADFSTNFRIDGTTYVSSDQRHKTNIIDNPYGLSTILQLQPRKFDRINSLGEVEQNNTNILGFIAQEVIEVLPEAVNYYPDEDTPNDIGWCRAYSLSESYIVSTLVNAVKELSAKNDLLEQRIATLEAN